MNHTNGVRFFTDNLSSNPTNGVIKICCYFSYKQRIDGTHGLQTVSSKSAVIFLQAAHRWNLLLFLQAAN